MGASDFTRYGFGKDAAEAFGRAYDEAGYENGHSYSGDLGSKPGYGLYGDVPSRMKVRDAVNAIATACLAAEVGESLVADERRRLARLEETNGHGRTRDAIAAYGDKWGEAVCLEVKGSQATALKKACGLGGTRKRVFVFFGLASS